MPHSVYGNTLTVFTCHLMQVNAVRLNASQADWDLSTLKKCKAELSLALVIYQNVQKSPIQVVTGS